jgi:hypothetical protein
VVYVFLPFIRYFYLIAFNVYLNEQEDIQELKDRFQKSFVDWMNERPELHNLLANNLQLV